MVWKKSCTTLDGWNPINNGINHLSTGAGFLPSSIVTQSIQTTQVYTPENQHGTENASNFQQENYLTLW
jgi:hypothetical protein